MDRDADPRGGLLLPAEWNQEDFSVAEMDPEARPRARGTPSGARRKRDGQPGLTSRAGGLNGCARGGQKTVVVQHVQVSEGGQAIVTAEIKTGVGASEPRGTEQKMTDEPQDHGWRAHLDLAHAASRCGARRKRDGKPCCQPAMPNGRCRVHGGLEHRPTNTRGPGDGPAGPTGSTGTTRPRRSECGERRVSSIRCFGN